MDAAIAKIYPFFHSLKGQKKEVVRTTHNLLFTFLTPQNP